MLRKCLASLTPLFLTVLTAAAVASPSAFARAGTAEQPAKLAEGLSTLHAVSQWSSDLSAVAEKRANSPLVKDYAHQMATSNSSKDAQIMALARKSGVEVSPLSPQTEQGKSVLDRMKAETVLLDSLQGDAFDKEYMTLVTNTQQSTIHFLQAQKAAAKDPDVKQFMGQMIAVVQNRLKTAQDIMAKVYGNSI